MVYFCIIHFAKRKAHMRFLKYYFGYTIINITGQFFKNSFLDNHHFHFIDLKLRLQKYAG